jgi:hypothetical protein
MERLDHVDEALDVVNPDGVTLDIIVRDVG